MFEDLVQKFNNDAIWIYVDDINGHCVQYKKYLLPTILPTFQYLLFECINCNYIFIQTFFPIYSDTIIDQINEFKTIEIDIELVKKSWIGFVNLNCNEQIIQNIIK